MVSSGNRMLTVNTKPHSAEPRCNEPPYIRSFAYNDLSGFVSHNFFCISNLNTLALTTKQLLNIVTVSEKTMQWCNQTRQVVLLWVLKFQFFYHNLLFLTLESIHMAIFTKNARHWRVIYKILMCVKSGAPSD